MAARYGESKSTLSYFVKTEIDNAKQKYRDRGGGGAGTLAPQ